ncbi:hypothetical protein BKE38_28900 [Pseudoroseomonas deserti]|uniref:DUF2934 domain-containing protein n=1 Tax=Teichococcus deserti TaxID=1817963 RepID=A0A1V2GU94_9PROT|nr:DUF2934 domain-containing protein [Pseudoroseomonas deserti]ONG43408.1 hypothetical protein BKE38_28900 [Pseudoroseomonas deserti]
MQEDATRQAEIETRAYTLWMESGQPEGRAEEFWHLAKSQIEAEERPVEPAGGISLPPEEGPVSPPPAAG